VGAERDRVAGFGRLEDGLHRRRHGDVQTVGDILRRYGPKAQQ
jgi:hypothetical protein